MSLCADPPVANLPVGTGASVHHLVNGTTERIVFKVKSSNNSDYRITPVYGFVEASNGIDINVVRTGGICKSDKLVVCFLRTCMSATDPHVAFNVTQYTGTITIPLFIEGAPPLATDAPKPKYKPKPKTKGHRKKTHSGSLKDKPASPGTPGTLVIPSPAKGIAGPPTPPPAP